MLHGKAFYVHHKYRTDHNYVSTDAQYVANDINVSNRLGWTVTVKIVDFRGEGALSILTTVRDLEALLPDGNRFHVVGEVLTNENLSVRRLR